MNLSSAAVIGMTGVKSLWCSSINLLNDPLQGTLFMARLIRPNDIVTIVDLQPVPLPRAPDSEQAGWIERAYQQVSSLQGQPIRASQIDRALVQGGLAEKAFTPREYGRLEGNLFQCLLALRKAHISQAEQQEIIGYRKRVERGSHELPPLAFRKLIYLINEDGGLAYGYVHFQKGDDAIMLDTYLPLARIHYQRQNG